MRYSICLLVFFAINFCPLLLAGEGPFLHVFVDRSVGRNDIVTQQARASYIADISCEEILTKNTSLFEKNGITIDSDTNSFYLCMLAEKNVCAIQSFTHLTSYETGKQLSVYPFPISFLQDEDGNFKKSVQLNKGNFTVVPYHFPFPMSWMTIVKRSALICLIIAALYGCSKMVNLV